MRATIGIEASKWTRKTTDPQSPSTRGRAIIGIGIGIGIEGKTTAKNHT